MKEFADDNFRFDKNGRKLSKQVENTVGKGEIARYKQFLLFPQCFQKACFQGASKGVIVLEWVNSVPHYPKFYQPERIRVEKQHFLLSCYISSHFMFRLTFNMSTVNALDLKFCCLVKSKDKDSLINPLPDDKILHWSKFKQIADDILKCI